MNVYFKFDQPLHGEDAPAVVDEKYLIICDGVGAGGQNRHIVNGEEHTSAYLASRLLSQTCKSFFDENYDRICENINSAGGIVAELKAKIKEAFDNYVKENNLVKRFKGRDLLMLPSTMAAVVYKKTDDAIDVLVINAGDSRAFLLTPALGLQQISKDDVDGDVDAYEKSTITTNKVNQERDFHLNYSYYRFKAPCVIFASSDGCFDYVESTMEFEYVIEAMMIKFKDKLKNDPEAFGASLGEFIKRYTKLQDDCSMAGGVFDLDDKLLDDFLTRAGLIEKEYVKPSKELSANIRQASERKNAELQQSQAQLRKAEEALDDMLFSKVSSAAKKSLKSRFKKEDGDESSETDTPTKIQVLLEESDIWNNFIADIKTKKEKSKKYEENLENEYSETLEKLRQHFKQALASKKTSGAGGSFFRSFLSYTNNFISVFTESSGNDDDISGSIRSPKEEAIAIAAERKNEFCKEVESLCNLLNTLMSIDPDCILDESIMGQVESEFINTKIKLGNWIAFSKQFYNFVDAGDREESAPDFDSAFKEAWTGGFKSYRKRREYDEMCSLYDKCIALQEKIENFTPFGKKEAKEMFEEFLIKNRQELIKMLKPNIAELGLEDEEEYKTYFSLVKKIRELRSEISGYVDKKKALWYKYKKDYELFLSVIDGGKV